MAGFNDGTAIGTGAIVPQKLALATATNVIKYNGGGTTSFTTTSSSFVTITGLTTPTVNHPTGGVFLAIGTIRPSMTTSNAAADMKTEILMDGALPSLPTDGFFTLTSSTSAVFTQANLAVFAVWTGVSAADHTFTIKMSTSAGTAASNNTGVNILIIPLAT